MTRAQTWTAAILLALGLGVLPSAQASAPVDHWARELSSTDPEARRAAARGLALLGRDASKEARLLLPLVDDPDTDVRVEVLAALLAIHAEGDAVAAAAWRSQAHDPEPSVRREARRLARKLGAASPQAARELRRGLAAEHADGRKAAVERLGRKERPDPADVNSLLALILDDEDKGVRSAAVKAIDKLGSPLNEHQAALRERLDAGGDDMVRRAAGLLGQAAPLEEASLAALIDVLLTTRQPRVRRAVLAPVKAHGRANPTLARRLLSEVRDATGARQEMAVRGLGALGTGNADEAAALLALRREPGGPRSAALKALVQLAAERDALPHVASSLRSALAGDRIAAAEVLTGVGAPARRSTPVLVDLASTDGDADVRSAALKALAAVAEPAVARPVLDAALKDRSSDVRSTARVQLKALDRAEERRARRSRPR